MSPVTWSFVQNRAGGCPLAERPTSHTTVRIVRYTAVQSLRVQRLVRFCRLPAVRCYYASFRIRLLLCTRKTSPGKRHHFHLIYLLHLRLEFRAVSDFVLSCKLVHFKTPFMQFLLPCLQRTLTAKLLRVPGTQTVSPRVTILSLSATFPM